MKAVDVVFVLHHLKLHKHVAKNTTYHLDLRLHDIFQFIFLICSIIIPLLPNKYLKKNSKVTFALSINVLLIHVCAVQQEAHQYLCLSRPGPTVLTIKENIHLILTHKLTEIASYLYWTL